MQADESGYKAVFDELVPDPELDHSPEMTQRRHFRAPTRSVTNG